jgi:S1-C subfamily serine protease
MENRHEPARSPKGSLFRRRGKSPFILAFVAFCLIFAGQMKGLAQSTASIKPDTPQLDTSQPAAPPAGPKGTLKGGVQHSENIKPGKPKHYSGKAQLERSKALQGEMQKYNAVGEAESGVGIIGVKFVMVAGHAPVINRVFPLTPAARSGLRPNDLIIAVDGIPTLGLAKEEVYDMIVGLPGTPVTLSIQREGEYVSMTMTRMDLNDITDPFVRRDYMTSM